MHKRSRAGLVSGFVLSAGLISCSAEKKVTDVYQAAPPVIQTGSKRIELKDWDHEPVRNLEMQDSLDFSASHPSRFQVRSHCQTSGIHSFASQAFANLSSVQVWQILPEEFLTQTLDKTTECEFELNLFNDIGSNHVFTLTSVNIIEQRPASLRLAHETGTDSGTLLRLTLAQMEDVRLRYRNQTSASAQVLCADMSVRALPFEQVANLALFDFANPTVREGRSPDVLQDRPIQNCRAVVIANGQRIALSALFQVVLPRKALRVQLLPNPLHPELRNQEMQKQIMAIALNRSTPIAEWRIENVDSSPHYLSLPKRKHGITISALVKIYSANQYFKMVYREPRARLYPLVAAHEIAFEDDTRRVVKLGPGDAFVAEVRIESNLIFSCSYAQMGMVGLLLTDSEAFTLEEVSSKFETISSFNLSVAPLQLLPSPPPNLDLIPLNPSYCPWPADPTP